MTLALDGTDERTCLSELFCLIGIDERGARRGGKAGLVVARLILIVSGGGRGSGPPPDKPLEIFL